ncbi:MAG: hypothetical protein HY555_02550 [Euryarchaeota archaeon]|nr:hypothetical protein [Euryarchaeota archaeon]
MADLRILILLLVLLAGCATPGPGTPQQPTTQPPSTPPLTVTSPPGGPPAPVVPPTEGPPTIGKNSTMAY